jgi:histidinol-phosphate aminotransferase
MAGLRDFGSRRKMKAPIRKSIEALNAYVPGEQPVGEGVVKLNTNENPYPPSPGVQEILSAMDAAKLRLYPPPLSAELRTKIADMHRCGVENVFAGNGSDEILTLCTRVFVENDGSIGYMDPSYSLYPVLADIRDVEKRPVGLGEDFGWPFTDDDDPAMRDACECSLFLLTNPNAPTGILYPESVVRRFCEKANGVVVIDEAYVDFSAENCLKLALELDNVLVLRTLSKSYSLAGLRVGYAVGADRLVRAIFKAKDSYNLDLLSQKLALAALSDVAHMRGNVEKIRKTRAKLSAGLKDRGDLVYPSEANFVWFRPGGISANELFERLRQQSILIRYFPGDKTGDCLRVTVGTDSEIDRLLDEMDSIRGREAR